MVPKEDWHHVLQGQERDRGCHCTTGDQKYLEEHDVIVHRKKKTRQDNRDSHDIN